MDRRELVEVLAYAGLTPHDMSRVRPEHVRPGRRFLPGPRHRGTHYGDASSILASARAASLRDECIIGAGMFMGLRQIEMRRLCLEDVERSPGATFLDVHGKGGGRRRVYVPTVLAEALGRLCALVQEKLPGSGCAYLFQSAQGPISARGISDIINKHIRAAGADITPHGLRHSFITWLLNTGATLEEAMEIAGHTAVSSHEIYAAAGESWFWDTWQRCHPLAARYPDGEPGSVYVDGDAYNGHMTTGTERIVPVPGALVMEILRGFEDHAAYLADPRAISRDMHRAGRRAPLAIREDGAIQMSENKAHPFFIALILGITPESVVAARFDRRGPLAERARMDAINRAVAPLVERKLTEGVA